MTIKDMLAAKKKSAKAQTRKKAVKTAAVGAAAGAALGVAAGLLLAPKPGSETRARIAQGARKASAALKRAVHKKDAKAAQE